MSISAYASDLSAASPSHSCEITQSNPSPQSGMHRPQEIALARFAISMIIFLGSPVFQREHTQTYTNTHTHRDTPTHTHTPCTQLQLRSLQPARCTLGTDSGWGSSHAGRPHHAIQHLQAPPPNAAQTPQRGSARAAGQPQKAEGSRLTKHAHIPPPAIPHEALTLEESRKHLGDNPNPP
eukprot:scaffold8444_cov102-Isochrysis_galbana.AAC.3